MLQNADTFGALLALALLAWSLSRTIPLRAHPHHHPHPDPGPHHDPGHRPDPAPQPDRNPHSAAS